AQAPGFRAGPSLCRGCTHGRAAARGRGGTSPGGHAGSGRGEPGRPLRVAVFGAGWGSTHRHLPGLSRPPGVGRVGVVDRNADRARTAARRWSTPRWAAEEDPARVTWLEEVDAVTVATPPLAHHAVAGGALRLSPHVLCGKPPAMNVARGEELVSLARPGTILAVVHNFQFSRAFSKLLRDLERGRLGPPAAFEGFQMSNPRRRLPVWYEKLPGGLFYDESPHLIYLLRRLGGGRLTFLSAFAAGSRSGHSTPDLLSAHSLAGDGVPARLTLNFVAPVSEWQISVSGEERLCAADI